MGSVVFYLNYVYRENPEGEFLTSIKVCAGRTVTGTTVRRRTLEKNMETLGEGSLTVMTVMQDGPSWVRRSVTYVR